MGFAVWKNWFEKINNAYPNPSLSKSRQLLLWWWSVDLVYSHSNFASSSFPSSFITDASEANIQSKINNIIELNSLQSKLIETRWRSPNLLWNCSEEADDTMKVDWMVWNCRGKKRKMTMGRTWWSMKNDWPEKRNLFNFLLTFVIFDIHPLQML